MADNWDHDSPVVRVFGSTGHKGGSSIPDFCSLMLNESSTSTVVEINNKRYFMSSPYE